MQKTVQILQNGGIFVGEANHSCSWSRMMTTTRSEQYSDWYTNDNTQWIFNMQLCEDNQIILQWATMDGSIFKTWCFYTKLYKVSRDSSSHMFVWYAYTSIFSKSWRVIIIINKAVVQPHMSTLHLMLKSLVINTYKYIGPDEKEASWDFIAEHDKSHYGCQSILCLSLPSCFFQPRDFLHIWPDHFLTLT